MESDEDIFDTSKIQFIGNFEEQVAQVLHHVRLTREEVENLQKLFDDLYNTFSKVWKNIKVMGFGSIVTGLGIRTSDVDCYVELPSWNNPPDRSHVLKAKGVLMHHPHLYENTFAIVNARVPIVKFYHVPTERNCDVNFNSPTGVYNSKLIGYLLQSDSRALQLAILVKYWSKIHNLTGTNLMPNYCLTMLVIFFLQQRDILPAVCHLQKNVEPNYVGDWNTAFQEVDNTNNNKNSLYQLLGGFFKYYKTFEYDKNIISPFIARPIQRELFANVSTVPPDFHLYKSNVGTSKCKPLRSDGVMCVQDPFEHNRNCSMAVHPKLVKKVLSCICSAVSAYECDDESMFLKKILTKAIVVPPTPISKKKKKPARQNGVYKIKKQNQNIKNFKQNARNLKQMYFNGKNHKNW